MKKQIIMILLILISALCFCIDLNERELKSRKLFSDSLQLLYSEKKYEARVTLNDALAGQMYIEDIPKFWYYAAKLDLQLGFIDRAKKDIENILLFSVQTEEVSTMQNFLSVMEEFSLSNYATPTFTEILSLKGNQNTYERFYTANDAQILNSTGYILDSKNSLIFKFNNYEEKWIELPKTIKAYSLGADDMLNRLYLGTDKGIYYMEPFSDYITFESQQASPVENEIKLKELRAYENNLKPLLEGFPAIIFGLDKLGRVVAYDPSENDLMIIGFDGTVLVKYKFSDKEVLLNGGIWQNYLYVHEGISNSIYLYDMTDNKILKKYPLDITGVQSLAVLPWGMPLISSKDGVFIFNPLNSKSFPLFDKKSQFGSFRGILRLKNGVAVFMDQKKYTATLCRFSSETQYQPYVMNVYGINVNDLQVRAKFSVTDISGNKTDFITKDLLVFDSGGRMSFEYEREYSKADIYEIKGVDQFFSSALSQIKTDSFVILSGTLASKLSQSQSVPLILSGCTVFYVNDNSESIDPTLRDIIYSTGGYILRSSDVSYLKRYLSGSYKLVDYVEYKLVAPIIEGIKQTKLSVILPGGVLSDSLYYYSEGVGVGK